MTTPSPSRTADLLETLAAALEHACDLLERDCGCEYAHGPECLAHGWRALVREARERAAAEHREQHSEAAA